MMGLQPYTGSRHMAHNTPPTGLNLSSQPWPGARRWQASKVKPSTQGVSYAEVLHLLKLEGSPSQDLQQVFHRRRLKAQQSLYVAGQAYEGLFLVRMGTFKSVITDTNGDEHVLAFAMRGDLLGLDGGDAGHYISEVVALSDAEVIPLGGQRLFAQGSTVSELDHLLYLAISREVAKEALSYTLTQAVRSDVRVARFLQHQSKCFGSLGYSPKCFTLHMTRRDVGNYLSVTLETVSRALSHLQELGIIQVHNRDIEIRDFSALADYAGEPGG